MFIIIYAKAALQWRGSGTVTQKLYRAKIVPGGTFLVTKFVPPRYTFGRQKCTGLAKSVPPPVQFW